MSFAKPILAFTQLFLFFGFAAFGTAQATDDQIAIFQQSGRNGLGASTTSNQSAAANACDSPDADTLDECSQGLSDLQGTPRNTTRNTTRDGLATPNVPVFRSGQKERLSGLPAPEPPKPPSDFQRFVESSVGELLPIYGESLFVAVPSTFAPVEHVPVNPEYTLGPGDEIQLRVWGQVNLSQAMVVDRAGDVFLPQAGRINLTGVRFGDVRDAIKSALGRVYRNFDLNVNMGQLRTMQVFVVGYARRPGAYTISSLSTLVNALFACGGPASGGSMRRIQLRRTGKLITTLDLYDLLLRGDKTKDAALESGDVIYIEARGPQVALAGSVANPAIYEITGGSSLRDLLDFGGGLSPVAATSDAILERMPLHGSTLESAHIALNDQGPTIPLRNGDIVRLLPVVPRFENSVTLRGNVADPVRFPWHEGMKISDVIPNRDALLTREYWTEHNRLAEKLQEHKDVEKEEGDLSAGGLATAGHKAETRQFEARNTVQPPAPPVNWNYAAIERTDQSTLSTHLIPFNLGKAVNEHEAAADLLLEPGDIITIFSEADFVSPLADQSKFVRLEGEVKNAGIYSVHPGETLRDVVARAGGLTVNAYLYGAEFTRESTRLEQQRRYSAYLDQMEHDLDQGSATVAAHSISVDQEGATLATLQQQRQAVEHLRALQPSGRIVLDLQPDARGVDALPVVALENGDRLVVPPTPSTVSVVGTVFNPSSFLFSANTSTGDYLRESGGPTRFADKSFMFILRADGSVVSAATHNGTFKGHFESLRMFPGDSLMVPSNVMKISRIRSLTEWSQVLSGFGLAAAAINVLK